MKIIGNCTQMFKVLVALVVLAAVTELTTPAFAAPSPKYDPPTITSPSSTQTSINIEVKAGATGAPAGFTLQWMTAAAFAANGNSWNVSGLCEAGFAGEANLSRYKLGPNESVTVNVGDFLFDNGASTNCAGPLICGTQYVFRAFAHGDRDYQRSVWTSNVSASTQPCGHVGQCTLTQGYWKNHNDQVCADEPNSPLCINWPVQELTLGTSLYNETQLLSILDLQASGNGSIALAHQLIAVKLNIANGADGSAVLTDFTAADALINSLVVPPVGSGYLPPSQTNGLTTALQNYNEGVTGPGHCE